MSTPRDIAATAPDGTAEVPVGPESMPAPQLPIELSVLVPVRDTDVTRLVDRLGREVLARRLPVDVHLYDDASDGQTLARNTQIVTRAQCSGLDIHMHGSTRNLGRAGARNALVQHSQGRQLLFLDADVLPDEPDFLRRYLSVDSGSAAVCGGISYRQCERVDAAHRFYLRYSGSASVATASQRSMLPWAWTFTANVLIARATFERMPFDAGFQGYGYEDLEWGLRLHQAGLLRHIDNPVSHMGLLSKPTLARKTSEAAANLVRFAQCHPQAAQSMALVRTAARLARLPAPLLRGAGRVCGLLFQRLPGPFALEWALFQSEKVLRAALAWRQAAGRAKGQP